MECLLEYPIRQVLHTGNHVPICLSAHTTDLIHLQEHCIHPATTSHQVQVARLSTLVMYRWRCGTSPTRRTWSPDLNSPTASTHEPRGIYLIVGAMSDNECFSEAHGSLVGTLATREGLCDSNGDPRSGYHYQTPSVVEQAKSLLVEKRSLTTIIFSKGGTRDSQHYLQLLGEGKDETLTEQVLQDLGHAADAAGKDCSCDVVIVSPEIVNEGVYSKVHLLPKGSMLGILAPSQVGDMRNFAKQLADASGDSDWSADGISPMSSAALKTIQIFTLECSSPMAHC